MSLTRIAVFLLALLVIAEAVTSVNSTVALVVGIVAALLALFDGGVAFPAYGGRRAAP